MSHIWLIDVARIELVDVAHIWLIDVTHILMDVTSIEACCQSTCVNHMCDTNGPLCAIVESHMYHNWVMSRKSHVANSIMSHICFNNGTWWPISVTHMSHIWVTYESHMSHIWVTQESNERLCIWLINIRSRIGNESHERYSWAWLSRKRHVATAHESFICVTSISHVWQLRVLSLRLCCFGPQWSHSYARHATVAPHTRIRHDTRMWCSVLQCVAVCCRVLQCVAVWCVVLSCTTHTN